MAHDPNPNYIGESLLTQFLIRDLKTPITTDSIGFISHDEPTNNNFCFMKVYGLFI